MTIQIVILAAGQGKRMHSSMPKVLHPLAGVPLLQHVITTASSITNKKPLVVIGHESQKLRDVFPDSMVEWIEQTEQRGTGHALLQALPHVSEDADVLVLYGDVPLISHETLKKLMTASEKNALGVVTAELENPYGYGRIKRDANHEVTSIIEEKDADENEKKIREINSGIYFVSARKLKKWLPLVKNNNAQQEYYLTDIIHFAVKENIPVFTVQPEVVEEILGVNDCSQLAFLERFYQWQQAKKFLKQGVTLADPSRFDVRGDVKIGRDVKIDVNVILEGNVVIGDGCNIGAHSVIRNTQMGNHVKVKEHSLIDGAKISNRCVIGPFARIRPDTELAEEVHVGNFVEVKKSYLGQGTKANHLSYLGDAEIGKQVNIGAGTITCNYDGVKKHKTRIGDGAFIGSDTQLVAPVTVGDGATIGAGSTIVKDAPAHKLTLSNARQQTLPDWKRREK